MEDWSKEKLLKFFCQEVIEAVEFSRTKEQEIEDTLQDNLDFFRRMVSQVPTSDSGPLLPKTPKISRKNTVQRIETIHEDESVEFEVTRTTSIVSDPQTDVVNDDEQDDDSSNRRSRRTASKRAASSIKQQQSLLNLKGKLRRPSQDLEDMIKKEEEREGSISSEEENKKPIRPSRTTKKASMQKKKATKDVPSEIKDSTFVMESVKSKESVSESKDRVSNSKRKHDETRSRSPTPTSNEFRNSRTRSGGEPAAKRANMIDETLEKSSLNDTLESSIYEDAIGRPAPIHNSTKIIDTTVTIEPKSREPSKNSYTSNKELDNALKVANNVKMNVTVTLETASKYNKNLGVNEQEKMEDEDVVDCTPEVKSLAKSNLQLGYRAKIRAVKNAHKANPIFSPYATDSVRKRVEAFEQVGLNSPKAVEVDAPTRVTRTKTRAMAAAEASVNTTLTAPQPVQQSITQKLARKSLAKAKKISLAKHLKDTDDSKENDNLSHAPMKISRLLAANEKLTQKMQVKITPLSKSRLQQPMSVNRLQQTPSNMQPLSSHSRAMSASRTNIVMNVESFLQSSKQAQKLSSAERLEEKKRRANEEDARRKRDEALKAQTEEKKRKREEKELKNKLAREAKEKLDREKHLKAEREREEKARIALQMQEKQREEAEKKRLLQLQRAQEKEKKRRQEEQLRLQRLQEQEEMERQLAEQKRKEQEAAERQHQRRLAEAKAQQQAVAEASKIKAQYPAKPAKFLNNTHTLPKQHHDPTSYKIESEPDEDDDGSDTEDAPKHPVPTWALAKVRKAQLAMQMYIPSYEVHRYFDSRRCTPDLTKIFEDIDKRRLKRTSSAIWKTPPRYSMMYTE